MTTILHSTPAAIRWPDDARVCLPQSGASLRWLYRTLRKTQHPIDARHGTILMATRIAAASAEVAA